MADRVNSQLILLAGAGALFAACGSDGGGPQLPAGVTCTQQIMSVTTGTTLRAALASAMDGDCIVAESAQYLGPFEMNTAGVTLVAARDADVTIFGSSSPSAAVRLAAERVSFIGIDIDNAMKHGLVITRGGVRVSDVEVLDSQEIGVAIKCEDQGCLMPTERIELADVVISRARTGLLVSRAFAGITGGAITGVSTESASGGAGLFAADGAIVEADTTLISSNIYGVVADGATTRVLLDDVEVLDNEEVGVWGQGLRGTAAAPGLEIRGAATRISGNSITGVGMRDSMGLSISAGEITQTIKLLVPVGIGETAEVGDGVGLFENSAEASIDGVSLNGNQRAQAVVDNGGANIRFGSANSVTAGANEYKVVVQNTASPVDVPSGDVSMAPMLPVRLLTVGAPAVGP